MGALSGSRASTEPASGLGPTGFDPERERGNILDGATDTQIERANEAVCANLRPDGLPVFGSAQGYACALTAIIECDKTADSLRAEIVALKEQLRHAHD
jgi:hypothetical protein